MEFKLNSGTTNELMNIGVKSKNQINGIMANPNYNYSKLPKAPKDLGNNYTMFKLETTIQKNYNKYRIRKRRWKSIEYL